ncbi:HAD-like protein [Imleria badia]|nr:HAD-like protein [Imleria badia]
MALQPSYASETPSLTLTEHRALIFDVYGTLIDWESTIHDALVHVFPDLPREEILVRYAGVEGKLQMQFQSTPYSKILELAYRQLAAGVEGELGKDSEQLGASASDDAALRFGRSIADWKPFPDTIDALHRLKKHFALVVLSNVDDHSFAQTHAKLCTPAHPGSAYPTITPDSPFALVLTAQQVGAYKPDPFMLASALRQLSANPDPSLPSNPGVHADASRVLVVANSLRHDILPAIQHGLRSVWISRYGVNVIGNERDLAVHYSDREGVTLVDDHGGKYPYTWRYETLGRMADAVEREVQK